MKQLEKKSGAAGAWLGFAGLGPRQVAVRGGAGLGFAGLGPRQGQPGLGLALLGWDRAAGAWLGFAGLGPRQVAVRGGQGQLGLGLTLLGWVLGRWQSGAGWQAGQGRTPLGFAGLGPGQVAVRGGSAGQGRWGWVLGRWQSGAGWQGRAGAAVARLSFAGQGPRQVEAGAARAQLGFAGLGSGQVAVRGGSAGRVGRCSRGSTRLCWAESWAGRADKGQAVAWGWAGWAVQGQVGLSSAWLGWVLGRWGSGVGRSSESLLHSWQTLQHKVLSSQQQTTNFLLQSFLQALTAKLKVSQACACTSSCKSLVCASFQANE
ncbi:hypothetical protein PPACK8108_LOCUS22004 [Phakopsora pachyrhizi]|uniref:Uncharacterized protein n=1 Tax=Phakopsora pachyrhizi TaxID=170000 RepID=A0AAV0BIW0_PHAPC|nr:hypothetical protein PPACK8108_LOCUS22004 [Phakopsora pachyrhizi]